MRTLKFRIWAEDSNRFYFLDSIFNIPNPCYTGDVQQFTGLTDSRGVEIYEGDIVHRINMPRLYQIVWNAKGCGWSVQNDQQSMHLSDLCVLDVIGNIFNNPELTQETQTTRQPSEPLSGG